MTSQLAFDHTDSCFRNCEKDCLIECSNKNTNIEGDFTSSSHVNTASVESLSISQDSGTLLPDKLAKIVSVLTRVTIISLRVGTYVTSAFLGSARVSVVASLGLTKRAIVGALHIAKKDANAREVFNWKTSSVQCVTRVTVVSQYFTSVSFYFAAVTLETTSRFTQDSVHLLDAIFGSTESSRAIAAIIALVRREMGEGNGIYSLFEGFVCFSILQFKGWHRTIQEIETHKVWDVLVLDTGETLSQQFSKLPGQETNDIHEKAILEVMPNDSDYRVAKTEVIIKTMDIEMIGEFRDIPKFQIPNDASIVHEESVYSGQNDSKYRLTIQTSNRTYGEYTGSSHSPSKRMNSTISRPENSDYFHLNHHRHRSFPGHYPTIETMMSDVDDYETSSMVKSPATHITRSFSDSSLSSLNKLDMGFKHNESLLDIDTPPLRYIGSSSTSGQCLNRQPSLSSMLPRNNTDSCLNPNFLEGESHSIKSRHQNIENESFHKHQKRSSSVYTVQSEAAHSYDYELIGLEKHTSFPRGHIAQNMAKYMRFATASYGKSFMHMLGIGKFGHLHIPSDTNHHSEHYVFAHHSRLGLEDILLSSYSDSAVDNNSGISLVHFVSVDHEAKAIVLTIRGTLGLEDILTDLTCDYEVMEWRNRRWKAHGGMLKCAQILKRQSGQVFQTIRNALEQWGPEYGLVICGHSLGGSVGALLGILLSSITAEGLFVTSESSLLPVGRPIHCFAYGPPATISTALRKVTRNLITTVVYGLDTVPCLSLGLLRDFQAVSSTLSNGEQGVVQEIKRRFLSQLASRYNPLFVQDADDDVMWSILKTLRAVMENEKLVPPGEVFSITTDTVLETQGGKPVKATRVIGKVVVDVEKRFRELVLGLGILDHSPVHYEQALSTLEMGVCNAPAH